MTKKKGCRSATKEEMASEQIKGNNCTFFKYPNGFVVGKCGRYTVGSCKTKKDTIKELKKMMKR